MPLVNRFPNYDPAYSQYNRAPRGYGVFSEFWRETVLASAYEQPKGNCQRPLKKPPQGAVKIACLMLQHYQPEDISLEVDSEKIILHGQYQCEQEDGFEKHEFTRVFKIPPGVDPSTVTLLFNQDHSVLVIAGTLKHEEEKTNDGEFEVMLDFKGFKPDGIKLQRNGNVLTATGIHHQSGRSYSRCILLPDDVDPGSMTSSLSKEGLLTIKGSRDQAKLSGDSSDRITITRERNEQPKEKTTSGNACGSAI